VLRMRLDTARRFQSPVVTRLSTASQPLFNWKNKMYATHRRDFDRAALRVEGGRRAVAACVPRGGAGKPIALGLVGTGPNGEDITPLRAEIAAYQSRMENPDLIVPAGQRPRYEAAFAKF